MKRRGRVWYIILLMLIILLAAELYLPGMAERQISRILRARTDQIEALKVEVHAFPAGKVLLGRMNQVHVLARGVTIQGLTLDSLDITYKNVKLHDKTFTGENTALDVRIKEDAVNRYIVEHYPELKNFQVKLTPDQLLLIGTLKIFDAALQLQLAGRLIIEEKDRIAFVPDDFQLEDIKFPTSLVRSYVQDMGFALDLKQLGIPLNIREIKLSSGELRLTN